MILTQINIFPVKSLDGYSPETAIVEREGLQYDRRFMIVDPQGMFMTQRTNGKMAHLKAIVKEGFLIISEKQKPENTIKIPFDTHASDAPFMKVTIWNDEVLGQRVSPEMDEFLSDFLEKPCHLVKIAENRPVEQAYNTGNDSVSFADAYPFLIIGEASMTDLNKRILEKNIHSDKHIDPLSIRRFRTNFIFSGGAPYVEDTWINFKIGHVDFTALKPCARCVLITRDPDTGIKGSEPLTTLQTYRQIDKKIMFGQNLIWNPEKGRENTRPSVKIGDKITVFT